MPTYQQLGHINLSEIPIVPLEHLPKLDIRVNDIRNTLGRVKSGDLHNIVPQWPFELMYLLFSAEGAEFAHIEVGVPVMQVLVEAIQPAGKNTIKLLVFDSKIY